MKTTERNRNMVFVVLAWILVLRVVCPRWREELCGRHQKLFENGLRNPTATVLDPDLRSPVDVS